MKWKELKDLAKKLNIQDDDIIEVQQNERYAVSSSACSIKINNIDSHTLRSGKRINYFIIADSTYKPEYQTPGFDRQ